MTLPLHRGGSLANECSDQEQYPHVHTTGPSGDNARVEVALERWAGDYQHRSEEADSRWTKFVRPPGQLARLLGDTMEGRIYRAAWALERQWHQRVRATEDALAAVAESRRPGPRVEGER